MTRTIAQREADAREDGLERDRIRRRYGVAYADGGMRGLREALREDGLGRLDLLNYFVIHMKRLRMGKDFLIRYIRRIAYGRRR